MQILIVASEQDPAGMNIARNLEKLIRFPEKIGEHEVHLLIQEKSLLELDELDVDVDADVFVFASKHVSKAGVHSLTLHTIGNWGEAVHGGRDKSVVPAPAALFKRCFELLLERGSSIDYEVTQEATHHGPFLETPSMFIEIGSDEQRWKDEKAGAVVAQVIIDAITSMKPTKSAIGLGGTHYCTNFQKVVTSEYAVTHVCPKHALEHLDEANLKAALSRNVPRAELVILDWKGLGSEKDRIVALLEKSGVLYKKTKDF